MRIGIRKMEAYTKPDVPKSPSATALPMNPPFEQTVAYCNTERFAFGYRPNRNLPARTQNRWAVTDMKKMRPS